MIISRQNALVKLPNYRVKGPLSQILSLVNTLTNKSKLLEKKMKNRKTYSKTLILPTSINQPAV